MNNWINAKNQPPTMTARYWIAVGTAQMEAIFYLNTNQWRSLGGEYLNPTHWQPLPEPPPAPDAFEEWKDRLPLVNGHDGMKLQLFNDRISVGGSKLIWDAAIASTKGGVS